MKKNTVLKTLCFVIFISLVYAFSSEDMFDDLVYVDSNNQVVNGCLKPSCTNHNFNAYYRQKIYSYLEHDNEYNNKSKTL